MMTLRFIRAIEFTPDLDYRVSGMSHAVEPKKSFFRTSVLVTPTLQVGFLWGEATQQQQPLKGLLHDQTKFQKLLLKSEFVKPNPSVQCLSLGREGVRLSSNAAHKDGISHLRYICHGCGNNKVENDSKPIWSNCRSRDAVKVHFINQSIFNASKSLWINIYVLEWPINFFKIRFIYLESL